MTTYVEVAQALVEPGYLSDADVEAAARVLEDALMVADAEDAKGLAQVDEAIQEQVISRAVAAQDDDLDVGNLKGAVIEEDIIAAAEDQVLQDEAVIADAEATIAAAYVDAAAALVAAELIDEANAAAAAAVIADVWVVDVE
jgi:hypothetical protein